MRFKLGTDKYLERIEDGIFTVGENMADEISIILPRTLSGYSTSDFICVFAVDTGRESLGVRLPVSFCGESFVAKGRVPGFLLSVGGSCWVELSDGVGTLIKSTPLSFSALPGSDIANIWENGENPADDAYEIFRGKDGKSSYELALEAGFEGTLEEWLDSVSVMIGKKIRSVKSVDRIDDTMVVTYDDGDFDTFIISDGKDGVGIKEIVQSEVSGDSGGTNVIEVMLDDGSVRSFSYKNGISCSHLWDGTVLSITSSSGTSSADLKGERGERGESGATGAVYTPALSSDGYLSWTNNGGLENPATVNIRGQKGDTGATGADGAKGDKGDDGYTPVRGTDYWTAADIAEIKSYVDSAILNGAW